MKKSILRKLALGIGIIPFLNLVAQDFVVPTPQFTSPNVGMIINGTSTDVPIAPLEVVSSPNLANGNLLMPGGNWNFAIRIREGLNGRRGGIVFDKGTSGGTHHYFINATAGLPAGVACEGFTREYDYPTGTLPGDNFYARFIYSTLFNGNPAGTNHFLTNALVDGNLGIGLVSAAPSHRLHVNGLARITNLPLRNLNERLLFANADGELHSLAAGTTAQFLRGDGTWATINSGIGSSCSTRFFVPRVDAAGSPNLACSQIMDNGSTVGINNTNPSPLVKLHVTNAANWAANSTVVGTYNEATVNGAAGTLGNQWAHAATYNEFNINTTGNFNDVAVGGSSIAANNFTVYKRNSGNINVPVTGCISTLGMAGSGTINEYSAYRDRGPVAIWNSNNSATINNYYGLYLSAIPQNLITNTTGRVYGVYQLGNNTINTLAGSLGVGTTNPQNKVEINSGIASTSGLRFTNLVSGSSNTTNNANQVLSVTSQGDVVLVNASSTGNTTNTCTNVGSIPRLSGTNTYGCSQLFDNGSNSVGVGTSTGFTYISLAGARLGSSVPTTTGTIRLQVNGLIRSTASIVTSDGKLKTEIKDLEKALEIVQSLNGKTYNWSEEMQKESGADNGRHTGFIAQDIQKVLPELVIADENNRLGVNYTEIIPILTEAIKELNAKVEKQNNAVIENEELKSKISLFEEKFALLEKSVAQICESGCAGLTKKIEENTLFQSIPNPTDKDALVNYFLTNEKSNSQIILFSQEGKDLESHSLEKKAGSGSIRLSLDGLTSGTYMYSLIVDNKVIDTKRLQIVK